MQESCSDTDINEILLFGKELTLAGVAVRVWPDIERSQAIITLSHRPEFTGTQWFSLGPHGKGGWTVWGQRKGEHIHEWHRASLQDALDFINEEIQKW